MKDIYNGLRASLLTGMLVLLCGSLFAQPANDSLCGAVPLIVDAACTTPNGNNTGATAQVGEPTGSCFVGGVASVWFSFVGPASGYVNITTDIDSSFVTNDDTEVALYALSSGTCSDLANLVQIACDQDGGALINFNSIITGAPAATGQTFYIQVSGWGTPATTGAFCIEVEEAPAPPAGPANDDVCGAEVLTVGAVCTTPNGTNTSSTAQIGEPFGTCFSGGLASVWFKFAAPASGFVTVTTDINVPGVTNTDTELALYTLTGDCSTLSGLTQIACDQDGGTVVNFNSIVSSVAVTPGDTIYAQVSGWGFSGGAATGDFCIEVIEVVPPANDNLCDAEALVLGAACAPGDLQNATLEPTETSGDCSFNNSSVWYSFVAPATGFVNISTDTVGGGTNTNTDISLYALPGGNCVDISDLFEVACVTGVSGIASLDTILVASGLTYYVQVSGGTGTFCIQAEAVTPVVPPVFPVNDSLCNAIPLLVDADCTSPVGDNTGATAQIGEPIPNCFNGGANSIWYSFVGPASGLVTITTDIDSSFVTNTDTEIALYELPGGDCTDPSALVELDCGQDEGVVVGFGFMSIISQAAVTPGATYYIQVSGYGNSDEGAFCMEIEQLFLPPSDDVCDAIGLPVDGTTASFYNINATTQPNEALANPPLSTAFAFTGWTDTIINNSVWFTFVAPASGAVAIDLCNGGAGTDFDTKVAVYNVGNCADFSTFTFLAGNDDLLGCSTASYLEVACLMPDSTYYLLVDGWDGDQGNFGITLTDTVLLTTTSVVVVSPTCIGNTNGSATVSAFNGGPFTYLWSTGATTATVTGLAAGTYTVQVFNACGDTLVDTALVADPAVLSLAAVATPPSCVGAADGSLDLVITGGTAPFTFTWSNGSTDEDLVDLAAGTYAVGVTDACGQTAALPAAVVPEATPVAVDAGADTTVCVGETVMLGGLMTASGGLPRTINRVYGINGNLSEFIAFKLEDPLTQTVLSATFGDFYPAGDFGGNGSFYAINAISGNLVTIDTITATETVVGPYTLVGGDAITGLAWNPSDSTMYGLGVTGIDSSSLYTFDIATGAATKVTTLAGAAGTLPIWLAISNDGDVYAMDIVAEVLQQIDPVAGTITTVGPTGLNTNFAQDADFDPSTNILYIAEYSGGGVGAFYTTNLTTNPTTLINALPFPTEMTAMGISPVTITPYEYTWVPAAGLDDPTSANPVATVSATTDYIVSVLDDCGVLISDTLTVSVPAALAATADGVQDNGDDSGSAWVTATGGIAPYTVSWSNGMATDTITGLMFGEYVATITDACGTIALDTFTVADNTSLEDLLAAGINVFEAYPNPSSGVFTLQVELADMSDLHIALYDVNGKILHQDHALRATMYEEVIDISQKAASGMYILEIRTAKGVAHKRINIH